MFFTFLPQASKWRFSQWGPSLFEIRWQPYHGLARSLSHLSSSIIFFLNVRPPYQNLNFCSKFIFIHFLITIQDFASLLHPTTCPNQLAIWAARGWSSTGVLTIIPRPRPSAQTDPWCGPTLYTGAHNQPRPRHGSLEGILICGQVGLRNVSWAAATQTRRSQIKRAQREDALHSWSQAQHMKNHHRSTRSVYVSYCVLGCACVCVLVWCVRVRSRAKDIFHGQKTQPTHEGSVVTEWHLCQHHYIYGHKTRCYQTRVATRPRLWQRDMLVVYPFDHIVRDWHATESLKSGWEFKQGKIGIVDKTANPSR